ncbi:MAG: LD-carboxypeptidase [Nitrospirae bacterium]|nr:LD-carboxypeptidase [Candidatus Manganitrophaceae bacterium]
MHESTTAQKNYIKPPALLKGGTIGIIAPSGRVNRDQLQEGITWLTSRGMKVVLGKHLEKAYRYFAGTDQERAEDFQEMFQNNAVDAIICARGGVGAARIIPLLDPQKLAQSPKILVGSSDITSLLLYLNTSFGWVTFHGPMVATMFGNAPSLEMETAFFDLLAGKIQDMRYKNVSTLRGGHTEGILTGGCLTLICTSIGTAYEMNTDDKILFLEDINEAPFRLDRMLSYLKSLHKFDRVKGVIFGQMPGCHPEDLPEIINDILGEYHFPILFGFPSGHGDGTATLPIGLPIHLNGDDSALKTLEPAVRLKTK